MTYLFIPQAGDREAIHMRLSALENAKKTILISKYNFVTILAING